MRLEVLPARIRPSVPVAIRKGEEPAFRKYLLPEPVARSAILFQSDSEKVRMFSSISLAMAVLACIRSTSVFPLKAGVMMDKAAMTMMDPTVMATRTSTRDCPALSDNAGCTDMAFIDYN